jgi:CubicO group peptidase (beta-lactamase class C family)
VLLARATGKDLESVLRVRIFEPLGMTDTGFTVPAGQLSRLTTAYRPDPDTGELSVLDDPARSWWSTPPSFPDGSGWLVSTIDDYWTFVSMMLAGGTGRGERILSPAMVALMTTDRLTSSQRDASALFLGEHGGWGLAPTGTHRVRSARISSTSFRTGFSRACATTKPPSLSSPGHPWPRSRRTGPAEAGPCRGAPALRISAQFPACDVLCAHPRAQKTRECE